MGGFPPYTFLFNFQPIEINIYYFFDFQQYKKNKVRIILIIFY